MDKSTHQDVSGHRKQPENQTRYGAANAAQAEKVPDSGSHEDFGENAGSGIESAPGASNQGQSQKQGQKEYTGATEAGEEDKGAKA